MYSPTWTLKTLASLSSMIIVPSELDRPLTTNFFVWFVLDLVILFGSQFFVSVFKIKACLNFTFIHLGFGELS